MLIVASMAVYAESKKSDPKINDQEISEAIDKAGKGIKKGADKASEGIKSFFGKAKEKLDGEAKEKTR